MGHVIAIDGPAGAGKSTIARRLADKLGYIYIDTGAMYRAVALWALREKIDLDDAHRLEQLARASEIELLPERRVRLNREDVSEAIRTAEVSVAASRVAAIGALRAVLVAKQRHLAETTSVVMEGRDIGTVVFPNARVKIFLDADPAERVRRRTFEQTDATPEKPRPPDRRAGRPRPPSRAIAAGPGAGRRLHRFHRSHRGAGRGANPAKLSAPESRMERNRS
jgi:cytidylate kinase